MTPLPRRLQLSRRKGFKLQEHSKAINGLQAVACVRPFAWGNPFVVAPDRKFGEKIGPDRFAVPTVCDAVEMFSTMLMASARAIVEARQQLRGKNLACACDLLAPCHCDVLLVLANAPRCEEVRG